MSQHYLLDLYGCNFDSLNNEFYLRDLLENSAEACGATVLQTMAYSFTPQGVTAISLLSESHISIHTWPEEGKAAVDIYTCGESIPQIACDIIIEQLKPVDHSCRVVTRL